MRSTGEDDAANTAASAACVFAATTSTPAREDDAANTAASAADAYRMAKSAEVLMMQRQIESSDVVNAAIKPPMAWQEMHHGRR